MTAKIVNIIGVAKILLYIFQEIKKAVTTATASYYWFDFNNSSLQFFQHQQELNFYALLSQANCAP